MSGNDKTCVRIWVCVCVFVLATSAYSQVVLELSGVLGDRCDLFHLLPGGVLKQEAASTSMRECFATVVQTLATLQAMLCTSTSFNFVFCSSADFESLSFGSMSLSFLDYVSESYCG
ncbi:hypothetical protein ILYODFUR_037197 [Ilyodon furcidens]|uniref:Secreted protein n=1 Tax=Ilyodon furcidens TaxID=33524 RepID=A0ABV0TG24_9TELE